VFDLLRRVVLFSGAPEPELRAMARTARVVTKVPGARIFEEGGSADNCYVVVSGLAKVVISGRRGKEITLDVVGECELVGEVALLDHAPRSAGLVAAHECRLVEISRASFERLRGSRTFEDRLVGHVTATLRRATAQLRAIHTFTSAEHVRWCLARLGSRLGRRAGATIVISPRPHHQDIADMTGCTRETVTRIIRKLTSAKEIACTSQSLILHEHLFARVLDLDGEMAGLLNRMYQHS
jgi:CRP/FNR family cyclic AMP-dependent transcriptional regulator